MDQTLPQHIELQVVTPERRVVSETVDSVSLPGREGRLGILPGHAPLVSELSAGVLSYGRGDSEEHLAVSSGFVEVLPGRVIVLARTAERSEEIDAERAELAKERAQRRLHGIPGEDVDIERAQAALSRALARLHAVAETPRAGTRR